MAVLVTSGAICQCSFGVAPSNFSCIRTVMAQNNPVGVITDIVPMMNIKPFGMCNCPANPAVVAATAAAFGVPTPAPCCPVIPAPWIVSSGKPILVNKIPALLKDAKCMCAFGGLISIVYPGQIKVV